MLKSLTTSLSSSTSNPVTTSSSPGSETSSPAGGISKKNRAKSQGTGSFKKIKKDLSIPEKRDKGDKHAMSFLDMVSSGKLSVRVVHSSICHCCSLYATFFIICLSFLFTIASIILRFSSHIQIQSPSPLPSLVVD